MHVLTISADASKNSETLLADQIHLRCSFALFVPQPPPTRRHITITHPFLFRAAVVMAHFCSSFLILQFLLSSLRIFTDPRSHLSQSIDVCVRALTSKRKGNGSWKSEETKLAAARRGCGYSLQRRSGARFNWEKILAIVQFEKEICANY